MFVADCKRSPSDRRSVKRQKYESPSSGHHHSLVLIEKELFRGLVTINDGNDIHFLLPN